MTKYHKISDEQLAKLKEEWSDVLDIYDPLAFMSTGEAIEGLIWQIEQQPLEAPQLVWEDGVDCIYATIYETLSYWIKWEEDGYYQLYIGNDTPDEWINVYDISGDSYHDDNPKYLKQQAQEHYTKIWEGVQK